MLTLFACPRGFKGHYAVIQYNAIRSWTLLNPKPRILLLGDDPGTAEIAKELGVEHIPEIARNASGTPLVNDLFSKAERASNTPLLAYVNADIILLNDFMDAVGKVEHLKRRFLMVGGRWDYNLDQRLAFNSGWEEQLRKDVRKKAHERGPTGIDYFVFPRGLWTDIPVFAIGRFSWDIWLISKARMSGARLIDASLAVMAIHQNHDYANAQKAEQALWTPEAEENRKLFTGMKMYIISDAAHRLTDKGIVFSLSGLLRLSSLRIKLHHLWYQKIWFPFLKWTRPFRRIPS